MHRCPGPQGEYKRPLTGLDREHENIYKPHNEIFLQYYEYQSKWGRMEKENVLVQARKMMAM